MDQWLLYVIIVSAIGIGWWLGRRERVKTSEAAGSDYYQGLNYLLNEEPDRAVNAFIKSLEVNTDTLETHLALGGLLRRRGELEKAVVVHENILSQARLDRKTMQSVELELARDYLLAGLLDRAEYVCIRLREESRDKTDAIHQESLKINLEIYEREKEWKQAIAVAMELVGGGDLYEKAISHYYCELAEQYLESNELELAHEAIREAIGHDVNNPRTSLLRGRIDVHEGKFDNAITALTRIRDQDPVYVPESLSALEEAYRLGNRSQEELREYLTSCLTLAPSISLVLAMSSSIRDEQGDEAGDEFVADHLKRNPSICGLTQLIDLHLHSTQSLAKENLTILRGLAEALSIDRPLYRCYECGFEGKRMRWHCPQCKDWATIKPINGANRD